MKFATRLTTAAAALACAAPALAHQDPAPAPRYQATYNPRTKEYCIRVYKEGPTTKTRPVGQGLNCRSQVMWERAGLIVTRREPGRVEYARR